MHRIAIPDSVINIGVGAFLNCGLTNATIGNSVTSIGDLVCKRPVSRILLDSQAGVKLA
jgi:hypothetical protein